jgi:lysophospholipase L1-like esterase
MPQPRPHHWRLLTPLLAPLLCPFALGSACEQNTVSPPTPAPVAVQTVRARPAPIAPVQLAPAAPDPSPQPEWPLGIQPIESPDALLPFYARLARVDAGEPGLKARVIHYGDSHIAADLWTGQLRRRLQGRFGDGGHGFLLPGKPFKGYQHQDVRHGASNPRHWDAARVRARAEIDDKLLGLGGYSVRTSQRGASVWASTASAAPGDAAAHFDLFYLEQPGGGEVEIRLDGKRLKRLSTNGPSTAAAYFRHEVPTDAPRHFEVESLGGGELRLFGLVMERAQAGVVYDSVGINGARATMPLAWDTALWQEHLARRSPDLMVLTYGTNEVDDRLDLPRYQDKVREVLTLMKEAVPGAACLLVGPPDRAWPVEGDAALSDAATAARMRADEDPRDRSLWDTPQPLIDILAAQRGAAREAGCAFWSTFDAMGGAGGMDIWARSEPALGQRDRIHLTRRGYEKVADNLAEALLFDYQRRYPQNLGSR